MLLDVGGYHTLYLERSVTFAAEEQLPRMIYTPATGTDKSRVPMERDRETLWRGGVSLKSHRSIAGTLWIASREMRRGMERGCR